jgi:release factor glutamine methyltransferase
MTEARLREVRQAAIGRLRAVSDTPALDADLLLCEALGIERAALLAHLDDAMPELGRARFEAWLARAADGEPIAYLLGVRGFYDREFAVTPAVLIPRPETELLLEQALAWAETRPVRLAADIGTGSGALAVTFAAHAPETAVVAVDLSAEALAVARGNAERHSVAARVTFVQGDLLEPLIARGLRPDLVMANLPYIPAADLPSLAVTRYEPRLALDGGPDGLDLIRRLLEQAATACVPGALLMLEIGAGQGEAVLAAARHRLPVREATVLRDHAGHDRVVRIEIGGARVG